MAGKGSEHPARTLWAYVYLIAPAQSPRRLGALRQLLDVEHAAARRTARTWAGRLVSKSGLTKLLVVSDSPLQDLEIHRRIAAALEELGAVFTISAPMSVADEAKQMVSAPAATA